MNYISKTCLALILPLSLVWACGSSGDSGSSNSGSGASGAGAAGTINLGGDVAAAAGDGSGPSLGGSLNGTSGSTASGGSTNTFGGNTTLGTTACSDGKDNDGDGLSDGFDPECTGPWDNDEDTFATGIPGDNRDPKWQDCFFDGNSGAGDDDCRYASGCLTGDLPADDKSCELTDACLKFCAPLTPNGCDCFGCCTIDVGDGKSVDVMASSTCSVANVDDTKACPRCVKSETCGNTCGRCELCPGKTVADLPADCGEVTGSGGAGPTGAGGSNGGPGYSCDGGGQVCGPDLAACALGTYCSQGCCIAQPPR
jgi:hypothetical protein